MPLCASLSAYLYAGQGCRLSRPQYQLLAFLMEEPGRAHSCRDIIGRLRLGPQVQDRAAENLVKRTRKKLADVWGAPALSWIGTRPGPRYHWAGGGIALATYRRQLTRGGVTRAEAVALLAELGPRDRAELLELCGYSLATASAAADLIEAAAASVTIGRPAPARIGGRSKAADSKR